VRYTGTAINGPFEQHDLSAFCASENHAVKVGTYIISRRNHITHRLRIGVKPDAFNPTLAAGDLVRVRLERTPSTGAASVHDYLYEVDRIGKSISGEVRLELTHFPVDADLASVVAKEVNAAVGAGFVLPTGLSGITCDVNSSSDTTVPADTSLDPDDWDLPDDGDFDTDVTEVPPVDFPGVVGGVSGGGGGGGGGGPEGDPTGDNPPDPNAPQEVPSTPVPAPSGPAIPAPGDPLTAPPYCEGGKITWYRDNPEAPGGREVVGEGGTYTPTPDDNGYPIYFEVECPDPTSPTGYSEPASSPWIGPVRDPNTSPWFPTFVPTNVTISAQALYEDKDGTNCSTGLPVTFVGPITTDLGFKSLSNVVEWRITGLSINFSVGCGPAVPHTRLDCILEGRTASGTLVSTIVQSDSVSATGPVSYTKTNIRTVLSIRYDGFLMNLDDFFPPP
jgi:hypothetical protein